jgi:subtilisin family serine protease
MTAQTRDRGAPRTTLVGRLLGAFFAVALAATALVGTSSVASAAPPEKSTYLVTFRQGMSPAAEAAKLRGQGWTVRHVYRNVFPGVAVELPAAAARALSQSPGVELVEPDGPVRATETRSNATWGLDRVDQRSLPLNGTFTAPDSAGSGVRVYVVDTGVRSTHVDFGGRVAAGYTAISDGRGTEDCDGHGTHVAGTSAGATWGLASRATIVPVRVLDCTGSGSWSGVVAGLDWIAGDVAGRPAVANMSLGGGANSTVDSAVSRAVSAGVSVVVAAGNENVDACTTSPARVGAAVTVGSTTSTDARSSFSNFGSCLDLFAPGSSITSTWSTGDTATNTISGTSMASPHVAGAVALLLGENGATAPSAVASTLTSNATTGVVTSAGTGSPNRLLYSTPGPVSPPPPPPPAPANDAFSAAATISVAANGSTTGSTSNATKESGEPSHAGNAGGASVWYRFTAPTTGSYTVSTEGSGFDTLLGVYTGSPVGALTQVAANDDNGAGGLWSRATFSAMAGTTYSVAIDGYGAASGSVTLGWTVPVVNPITVTTSSLPAATVGAAYSTQLAASGGSGSYRWSLASGTLPTGLTLSSAGVISGTATTGGTSTFTVGVTDTAGRTATRSLSITVNVVLPGSFNKTSPKNGATNLVRSGLSFSWAAATGATSYEICISRTTTCDGSGTAGWVSTGTARTTSFSGLASRTTYYWQVRAVNAGGTRLANTGTWWRFTTRA